MSYLSLKPGTFFTVICFEIIFEIDHFPFLTTFLNNSNSFQAKLVTFTRANAEKGLWFISNNSELRFCSIICYSATTVTGAA